MIVLIILYLFQCIVTCFTINNNNNNITLTWLRCKYTFFFCNEKTLVFL